MTGDAEPGSQPEAEPSWAGKVLRLSDALTDRRLPYAFGGAIALNYHREPRSTLDIDINIFIGPDHHTAAIDALTTVFPLDGQEQAVQALQRDAQTRTAWGSTFVDLFLANTDFHASMANRIQRQPFGDGEIPVLSIEDLLICKVLFDRPKDWIDIDAVAKTRRGELDGNYTLGWLGQFLEPSDPRLTRIAETLSRAS